MNVCSFLYTTIHLQILSGDPGEDSQVHACKLLEVTVLQCQGRIDPVRLCVCVYIFSIGTVQNLDSWLDSIMDSIFGPKSQSTGVKGHMQLPSFDVMKYLSSVLLYTTEFATNSILNGTH